MMRRAREMDPYSGYAAMMLGFAFDCAGDYEAALTELRNATELDASMWVGHMSTGMTLERLGRIEEALVEFRLAVDYSGHGAMAKALLAFGLARSGDQEGALELLNSLLRLRQRRYFSPYWISVVLAALGRRAEALRWLEIANEERSPWIVFLREDPKLACLQSDRNFQRILESVDLHRLQGQPATECVV